jgi:hypothetical protein
MKCNKFNLTLEIRSTCNSEAAGAPCMAYINILRNISVIYISRPVVWSVGGLGKY